MSNKMLAVGAGVLVLIVVIVGGWQVMRLNKTLPKQPPVTYPAYPPDPGIVINIVQNDFGSKIVYRMDSGVKIEGLQQDCSSRGGTFNDCGTVCPPDAQACITMCGWTCDNIPPGKPLSCDANTACPTGLSCYLLPGAATPECVAGNVCQQACGTDTCVMAESYPPQVKCQKQ